MKAMFRCAQKLDTFTKLLPIRGKHGPTFKSHIPVYLRPGSGNSINIPKSIWCVHAAFKWRSNLNYV